MTSDEERCWKYILANRQATADEVAEKCDVGKAYAVALLSRIASENWREPVASEKQPERLRLLQRGMELTGGDRNKTYGPPWANLTTHAVLWEAYLEAKFNLDIKLTAEDVAHMMTLVKMTRTFHGSYHADNYLDGAVYQAIAGECRLEEERE
jgi:hypothetical protein